VKLTTDLAPMEGMHGIIFLHPLDRDSFIFVQANRYGGQELHCITSSAAKFRIDNSSLMV
jgi:hypothetical protein